MRVDGAQTGDEGGWRSNERREWMALKRVTRVDGAQTSEEGRCGLNE